MAEDAQISAHPMKKTLEAMTAANIRSNFGGMIEAKNVTKKVLIAEVIKKMISTYIF